MKATASGHHLSEFSIHKMQTSAQAPLLLDAILFAET
jgi:hypothetical protein